MIAAGGRTARRFSEFLRGARRGMSAGEGVLSAAAGLQTVDAEALIGELFLVFRHLQK